MVPARRDGAWLFMGHASHMTQNSGPFRPDPSATSTRPTRAARVCVSDHIAGIHLPSPQASPKNPDQPQRSRKSDAGQLEINGSATSMREADLWRISTDQARLTGETELRLLDATRQHCIKRHDTTSVHDRTSPTALAGSATSAADALLSIHV